MFSPVIAKINVYIYQLLLSLSCLTILFQQYLFQHLFIRIVTQHRLVQVEQGVILTELGRAEPKSGEGTKVDEDKADHGRKQADKWGEGGEKKRIRMGIN